MLDRPEMRGACRGDANESDDHHDTPAREGEAVQAEGWADVWSKGIGAAFQDRATEMTKELLPPDELVAALRETARTTLACAPQYIPQSLYILAADEINRLRGLIAAHNDSCQSACGYGELEAARCQYRPYLLTSGRRCPECPTDWKIEL